MYVHCERGGLCVVRENIYVLRDRMAVFCRIGSLCVVGEEVCVL